MQTLWLAALLSFGTTTTSLHDVPSGSLIFLENASSVVEYSTRGKIGHVALAFQDGGETWIYEATPAKVRRVTAAEYGAELARINARRDEDEQIREWLLVPKQPYTGDELARMREFVDAQIGRRYSVRNYVRGKSDGPHTAKVGPLEVQVAVDTGERKSSDGIHCAELASSTLSASGRYDFADFHKIHPQALYTAVLATHQAPVQVAVATPATAETWCVRAQRRWAGYWNWCRWGCGEAWAFCW